MSAAPTTPAVLLGWDSRFWGVRIGRATPSVVADEPAHLRVWTVDNAVDCLYLRCVDGDPRPLAQAADFGFCLMESRVEYERVIVGAPAEPEPQVRAARDSDLEALSGIARLAHHDSRFYVDPHFPDDRCDDLFVTWIVNSVQQGLADWVLVADVDGQAQGYVTGRFETAGTGRIGLIAVAEGARGRGVGRALLAAAAARFDTDGIAAIIVATQARNEAAKRLYEHNGFVQRELSYDLHWWRDDSPAPVRAAR